MLHTTTLLLRRSRLVSKRTSTVGDKGAVPARQWLGTKSSAMAGGGIRQRKGLAGGLFRHPTLTADVGKHGTCSASSGHASIARLGQTPCADPPTTSFSCFHALRSGTCCRIKCQCDVNWACASTRSTSAGRAVEQSLCIWRHLRRPIKPPVKCLQQSMCIAAALHNREHAMKRAESPRECAPRRLSERASRLAVEFRPSASPRASRDF
jgi:hypothetical protein